MKITQINATETIFNLRKANKNINKNQVVTNPETEKSELLGSEALKNYFVNFKSSKSINIAGTNSAKMKALEAMMSPQALELIDSSRKIAKKYGYNAINQTILLLAGLIGIKKYIEDLNTGEVDYGDNSGYFAPSVIIEETTPDVFKKKQKRNII